MAQQMTFDLPVKTALGREDFFISAANALAVEMLENWPKWPNHKLALIGPKGAGKTHLTQVWAADTGATVIPARTLADADIPTLRQAPVAVEDIRDIASNIAQPALTKGDHRIDIRVRRRPSDAGLRPRLTALAPPTGP